MKRFLPVILTLLLAVALVLLYQSRQTITELEKELTVIKSAAEKSPPRPQGPVRPAGSNTTVASKSPGKPAADQENEKETEKEKNQEDPKSGKDAMDLLLGAGKKEVADRSKARIALLRDRLKLSPDQLAALEKSAAERNEFMLAAFERLRKEKGTPPDLGVMIDWMLGNHDLPVKPLQLDAEQEKAWSEMAQSERTGRVEGMVNMELLELQSQGGMHLTPEQKDQVFSALSTIVAGEDAIGAAYYADDGQFMARIDDSLARRRAALATVLDETMMQSYDKMLVDDRAQIISLFAGSPGAK